jgi:hypothetical protein
MENYYAGLKQLLSPDYRLSLRTLISLVDEDRFTKGVDSLKGIDVLVISRPDLGCTTDFKDCIFQSGRLEGISSGILEDMKLKFHRYEGALINTVIDIIPVHTLRLPEDYSPEASSLKIFTFGSNDETCKVIDMDPARGYVSLSKFGKSLKLEYIEKIARGRSYGFE